MYFESSHQLARKVSAKICQGPVLTYYCLIQARWTTRLSPSKEQLTVVHCKCLQTTCRKIYVKSFCIFSLFVFAHNFCCICIFLWKYRRIHVTRLKKTFSSSCWTRLLEWNTTLHLFHKQRSSKRVVYGFLNFDSRCLVLLIR